MLSNQVHQHDQDYDQYVQSINDRYAALTGPIFETDATGLYGAYLDSFADPADRQYHTCSCCRQFIERFGALATVSDAGQLVPAVWVPEDAPAHYRPAVEAMARLVRRAKVTVPFLSKDAMYGVPVTGEWHHFAIKPPTARIFRMNGLDTPYQVAALKREEFGSVSTALVEYNADTVKLALRLLKDDTLGNAKAVVGQAQFLADLHALRESVTGSTARANLVYRAVAEAPSGLCHPRTSMVATLLDDIAAGKTFEQAQAAWSAKMHPLRYQRPQAAPTAGAIAAAEKAFEQLGAASSLQRRYATYADLTDKLWTPAAIKPAASGGIFGSIKPKGETVPLMRVPAQTMTWEKFCRLVLPTAEKIEAQPSGHRHALIALTTAAHADAVPLLQWDREAQRNPVAYFLYHGGSPLSAFNLRAGFTEVKTIVRKPSQWHDAPCEHQGEGAFLLLEGAKDINKAGGTSAIFPNDLKAQFHGFRSVIEAYSKSNALTGWGDDNACGLALFKANDCNVTLRVTSAGQTSDYKIDRWD